MASRASGRWGRYTVGTFDKIYDMVKDPRMMKGFLEEVELWAGDNVEQYRVDGKAGKKVDMLWEKLVEGCS